MIRQYELVERVRAYNPAADEALLNRAYVFAMRAHGTQLRASGDPYFSHPLEVAGILTDLRLDEETIATALLHDTLEDTAATYDELVALFGPAIADLVDGVTKLSRIELTSDEAKQAENFRKLLLAMSKDVRVLLVKLADRLHNMRTLDHVKSPDKRRRIANETMEIYAPLAGRMGMQDIREELEDLAFRELQPEARGAILRRLEEMKSRSDNAVIRIALALKETLAGQGLEAQVSGREKRPYSIWRKLEARSISFEQLSDIIGFRVVVPSVADCYRALGIIHTNWKTVPGRFKDYISTPKRNDYRSIHTTIFGPEGQRVEMQIRTAAMQEVAERGIAAHWRYKDIPSDFNPVEASKEGRAYQWLREVVSMLERGESSEDFLENTKLEMFFDQVFCFTPKGHVYALPRGATPIDFAYAVHTDIGHSCVGAKVNGRPAALRMRLENGDMVEIIRAKTPQPQRDWESIVVTGKARSAIRHFIRQRERAEFVRLGRELIERAFEEADAAVSDRALEAVLGRFKLTRLEELHEQVGRGHVETDDILEAIFPGRLAHVRPERNRPGRVAGRSLIPVKGHLPGVAVHLAPCCHPLPGDRIVGIVEKGRGLIVHAIDCAVLARYHDRSELWRDLSWDPEGQDHHVPVGRLEVALVNEPGALGALCTEIGRSRGNISNLRILDRHALYFRLLVDVEVHDLRHLTQLMAALRAHPQVKSVDRLRAEDEEVHPQPGPAGQPDPRMDSV
ncbi:MAG: bifunctional (p)ppGpp synthetase/guanosine-3',5'-bis(diphosphate) 3'-pyrophosphohydrolase [Alphaproteobacteria bacterium]|nr:bifunctional (p)ppGpp synthetase/guanosine-3',5'-bis(diphosphate) 3'-pyrophosphohydrolase [Alphaproteobacteria bacterium]